jgi:hypothetical protein
MILKRKRRKKHHTRIFYTGLYFCFVFKIQDPPDYLNIFAFIKLIRQRSTLQFNFLLDFTKQYYNTILLFNSTFPSTFDYKYFPHLTQPIRLQ